MSVMKKIEAKAKCLVNLMERMKVGHNDPTKFVTDQLDNLFICLRNDIKQPWNDWTLQVAKSTIDNAGRGLFLDGHAPAGRLLCLYSGELWREQDVENLIAHNNAGSEDAKYYLDQCYVMHILLCC